MSGKYTYPYVARNSDTGGIRFLGMFHTMHEAQSTSVVDSNEQIMSKVPTNGNELGLLAEDVDYVEHDFALLVQAWLPDEPNKAQTSLTKRCLRIDCDKVHEIASEINGIPQADIQVSRWAMLYNSLDRLSPKVSKPIEGWV